MVPVLRKERALDEERRERLEAELESAERVLCNARDFLNDNRNLTEEGIAAREVLLGELEAMELDLEALRQEYAE